MGSDAAARRRSWWPIWVVCWVVGSPAHAAAQSSFTPVGARAQGMGGAFVSVADDATATYWNPAGLPAVPLFDLTLAFGAEDVESDTAGPLDRPVGRARSSTFAAALPVLGFSYVRLHTVAARPSTAADGGGREEGGTAGVGRSVTTRNFGLTLVQSLSDAIVVGTTLRLVRGEAAGSPLSAGSGKAALDSASELYGNVQTRFDADVGLMTHVGAIRVGLVVRNLASPRFDAGAGMRVDAERLARVGVSWGAGPPQGRRSWVVAADADLTVSDGPDGARRALAIGGERWLQGGRFALRGGARGQTTGAARPVATGGASVALRSGVLVEGQVTAGGDRAEQGWSIGARLTF